MSGEFKIPLYMILTAAAIGLALYLTRDKIRAAFLANDAANDTHPAGGGSTGR